MKKRDAATAEQTSATERPPEDVGSICSQVVNKYSRPNINARTMMLMPEFWTDITKALRGEPVDGIDIPGIGETTPTLVSLDPATAELNSPDLTLRCLGTGFTPESVIVFAGVDEPIVFVSAGEITTVVKPSLGWGAVTVPVSVRVGEVTTDPRDFTFTEAAAPSGPAPVLITTNPDATQPDQGTLSVQVVGQNFVDGGTVYMDNVAQTTSFVAASTLMASIPTAGVALGQHPIKVVNPDLQESGVVQLTFVAPTADEASAEDDDEGPSRRRRKR
jgi:hypothetical protein